eukprot:1247247-Rhodomonas_salina.4
MSGRGPTLQPRRRQRRQPAVAGLLLVFGTQACLPRERRRRSHSHFPARLVGFEGVRVRPLYAVAMPERAPEPHGVRVLGEQR